MKTIVYTTAAARDIDTLPADVRIAVEHAIIRYAVDGDGDVKKLSGTDGYRLRVGRYRVIFDEDAKTILAIYVDKRETQTYARL